MALTFGSEFTLFMHATARLTYTEIETAMVNAGLDDVSINRNPSGNGEYDVQVIIRSSDGTALPAAETITALAEAIEVLEPEPTE